MFRPARVSLSALVLALALSPSSGSASVLWFGDKDGLHQIDMAANRVVTDVAFEPPVAIAVNAAGGSAWVLTQSRIAHVASTGALLFDRELRDLGPGLGAPRLLALNPNDGSVWAAFENRILHFDGDGALRHTLPVSAIDLAVAQEGSLWVAGPSALQHYDSNGTLLSSALIGGTRRIKSMALDDTGGALWLAGEKEVLKLSLTAPHAALLSFFAPETSSAISLDIQTGDLWLLGQQSLFSYRRDGTPLVSRDLRDFAIANPASMLFDFASQSAWVGHQGGLSRIASFGTMLATFAAEVQVGAIAIGRTPVDITPVVSILAPADGALLNTATPRLTVGYDALCSGAPCGFPDSFFASFTLSAQLNGTEVGGSFVFDSATGTASFTPTSPLPEGSNTLAARASDSFGHQSDEVSITFTVDTIGPSFVNVAPPSGSVFLSPAITITGNVDDPQASVVLGAQTQGQFFSFPVTLARGVNNFTLIARDPAGNSASFPLTCTYEPPNVPPVASITSPVSGASFEAPATFSVTADASDPDGQIVRVEFLSNNVVFFTDTLFPYSATLSNLPLGSYTLTARATDDRNGSTSSDPVSVTVGPPNALPAVQLLSPTTNAAFSAPATVPVVARASDSDGTIAKVEFFRNGVLAATVFTGSPDYSASLANVPAGTHTITARATDDRGGTRTTAAATINVAATSIVITSPAPNASIGGDSVLVTGRITALSNSGVLVNQSRATIDGAGNFRAIVPLVAGPNTLTARLTTVDETVLTAVVSVTATGIASPFAVIADPTSGLAPLTPAFRVVNTTTGDATFTFDGFGPFPLPAGAISQLSVTYPAGVYVTNVVITSAQGTFVHQIVIDSKDEAAMDAMFRSIWSGLTSALAAGDREGALRYLNLGARDKFGAVFTPLMPFMPEIVASFSPPAKAEITAASGEYGVSRMDGAARRLYLISFVQGADGVWRVDEM